MAAIGALGLSPADRARVGGAVEVDPAARERAQLAEVRALLGSGGASLTPSAPRPFDPREVDALLCFRAARAEPDDPRLPGDLAAIRAHLTPEGIRLAVAHALRPDLFVANLDALADHGRIHRDWALLARLYLPTPPPPGHPATDPRRTRHEPAPPPRPALDLDDIDPRWLVVAQSAPGEVVARLRNAHAAGLAAADVTTRCGPRRPPRRPPGPRLRPRPGTAATRPSTSRLPTSPNVPRGRSASSSAG